MKLRTCSRLAAACAPAVIMLFWAAGLHALDAIDLRPNRGTYLIGRQVEFLEDAGGKLAIGDVSSPEATPRFRASRDDVLNLAYTNSAWWVRFAVRNRTGEAISFYLHIPYALLDDIRLYEPVAGGRPRERKTGRLYPFDCKEFPSRHFNFAIDAPARSEAMYYLRVTSRDSLVIPVELRSRESLILKTHIDQLLMGLYYGVILIMIMYNILILITTRDINYLYYVLSLAGLHFLFQAGINGLTFEYFGRSSIWWARTSIAFFFSVGAIFTLQFCRSFLNARKMAPILNYFLIGGIVWGAVEAVLALTIDYFYAIQSVVVFGQYSAALMWLTGLVSFIRGNRAARFYLLAWTSFIFGGIVYSLKVWGFIPSTFGTEYTWQIGSLVQAFLLAMALGDNINILRTEKINAQHIALEKEKEAREAQERFSETLERQVDERTNDLNLALEELRHRDSLIQKELDLASGIQRSILPETPLRYNGLNIVAYYRAIEKIGGDFFDIFPIRGGHLCVLIADASGHGIPAAFVTALAKISFAEATRRSVFPRDVLRSVNTQLIQVLKAQFYLTAFLVIISPSLEVYYANASHQKAMVFRKRTGAIEEWDTGGLFVGAVTEASDSYEDRQDVLDFGDRVVLYTDGLVEARNAAGLEFGQGSLGEILSGCGAMDVAGVRDEIVARWRAFTEGSPVRDDMSFIIFEVDPSYRLFLEHKNSGIDSFANNRTGEAIRSLEQALAVEPGDAETHHLLGKSYAREKNFTAAHGHLEKYLELNDDDADAWQLLAGCQFNLHRYEDAMKSARRACQLRRAYPKALMIWAYSLKKLDRASEAIPLWEQVLKAEPDNEAAREELALLGRGSG